MEQSVSLLCAYINKTVDFMKCDWSVLRDVLIFTLISFGLKYRLQWNRVCLY